MGAIKAYLLLIISPLFREISLTNIEGAAALAVEESDHEIPPLTKRFHDILNVDPHADYVEITPAHVVIAEEHSEDAAEPDLTIEIEDDVSAMAFSSPVELCENDPCELDSFMLGVGDYSNPKRIRFAGVSRGFVFQRYNNAGDFWVWAAYYSNFSTRTDPNFEMTQFIVRQIPSGYLELDTGDGNFGFPAGGRYPSIPFQIAPSSLVIVYIPHGLRFRYYPQPNFNGPSKTIDSFVSPGLEGVIGGVNDPLGSFVVGVF